ncbi:hypothetical protein PX699_29895 [Sphingobium sp. H39-3-25]|uniref:hypothetical protein n=1 Tax=Sphingobium arseniciresistens TaxID=3030834 RepID=UPI0023B8EDF0|nr:hypothetical protein [Sphingobium arseniciresistens]
MSGAWRQARLCAVRTLGLVTALIVGAPAAAQEAATTPSTLSTSETAASGDALAQQLQNPVASLIQVPIQNNVDFNIGPEDGLRVTTNIQPVVPVPLNERWNIVSRTILPVIYQSDVTGAGKNQFGLGDTVQSFFFSPKLVGESGIIWGAGPVFLLPTGTRHDLSGKKWGVGPTGVVLKQAGPWTYGMLVNQIWSVAGSDAREDQSLGFAQPFVSYVNKDLVTYSASMDINYDWIADQATIPISLGISKLIKGQQPISIGAGVRYYIEKPMGGPDWGVKISVTLLFPQ